jgi:hypothetical protein
MLRRLVMAAAVAVLLATAAAVPAQADDVFTCTDVNVPISVPGVP